MPAEGTGAARMRIVLAVVALIAAGGGIAWFLRDAAAPSRMATPDAAAPRIAPRASAATPPAHDHAHDDADIAPDPDLTASFFDAPRLADAARFAPTSTRLLPGGACQAHPVFARQASAEDRLGQLYAWNTRERFPQDVFYRTLTQFWQQDGAHYQLSASWDIAVPPVYQVRLHRSARADFGDDVREVDLPLPPPAVLDAASTSEYIARVVGQRTQAGARMGLRILDVEWPGEDGGRIRATLADGRPVAWTFPGGRCVRAAADALQCRCRFKPPAPATGENATS